MINKMCWCFVIGYIVSLILVYFTCVLYSWEWVVPLWEESKRTGLISLPVFGGAFFAVASCRKS